MDVCGKKSLEVGSLFCGLRRVLAVRKDQYMTFVLGAIAVVLCIALALQGYVVSLIVGGILGSFVGIAGFGTAVPGTLAGAIVGALVAIALKKGTRPSDYSPPEGRAANQAPENGGQTACCS